MVSNSYSYFMVILWYIELFYGTYQESLALEIYQSQSGPNFVKQFTSIVSDNQFLLPYHVIFYDWKTKEILF